MDQPQLTLVQRHFDAHVAAPCTAETSEEEASLQSMQGKPAAGDSASSQPGRLHKYRRWLGHWKPEHDHIRTETELALHVSTSSSTCSSHDLYMISTKTIMCQVGDAMHVVHRMTTDNLKCASCLCNVHSHTADLSHGFETQLLPVQLAAAFESCSISVYTASTVIFCCHCSFVTAVSLPWFYALACLLA